MPSGKDESVLLHRIDERMSLLVEKLAEIGKDMDKMQRQLAQDFVSREEFAPVKSIVYGIVTAMFIGVLTALGTLVLKIPQ